MVKLKVATTIITALLLTGCASWSFDSLKFWQSEEEPTIEEQMNEQFNKVSALPKSDMVSNEQVTAMHNEWTTMKPDIEDLIRLKSDLETLASMPTMQVPSEANNNNVNIPQAVTTQAQNNLLSNADIAALKKEQSLLGQRQETKPASKPKETTPQMFKYSMQIAATGSKVSAENVWKSQLQKFPEFLGKFQSNISKTMANNKEFHRVKVGGFDTIREAQSACNAFKQIGGQCIIRENKLSTSFGIR